MADLQLFFNQEAANRSVSLVNRTGSGALPVMSLPLVFADIYSCNAQFVDKNGVTGSYFSTSGSTATLALGLPGEAALALATCSFKSSSSYSALFQLNTNELSASIGSNRSRQYILELQVVSGSSVITYQNPCAVYRDVVANALYPLSVTTIISASYASNALSASYAKSASWADKSLVSTQVAFANGGGLNASTLLIYNAGVDDTTNYYTQIGSPFAGALILANQSQSRFIRLNTDGNSYIGTQPYNFGIGTESPTAKLHVQGNISASSVTASLLGTSSYANTASFLNGSVTSASYSTNSSTASFYNGSITSASYATTAITCSGIVNANQYSLTSGFANYYTASFSLSNTDDGRYVSVVSGAAVNVTISSSLNTNFNCLIFQSGSGQVSIITGSTATVLRNRQSFKSLAGQYAVASLVRVASGDFILSGDLA